MLIPIVAALIALVAALSGYTMVKFFGVIFLGQPRENKLAHAHDAGMWERAGMLWLALGCVALGLLAVRSSSSSIDPSRGSSSRAGLGSTVRAPAAGCWCRSASRARATVRSIFLLGLAASFALAFAARAQALPRPAAPRRTVGLRLSLAERAHAGHGRGLRPADPADLRAVLSHAARAAVAVRRASRVYRVVVGDHFWHWIYLPVAGAVERMSRWIGQLQQGRIAVYLLYSFVTLVGVLLVVTR